MSSSSSLSTVSCPINSNTFPGKLWKLVNGGRFQSIGWSNGGTCVAINGTTFKNEILYNEEFNVFKTQNFSSFVRQLNLYGFRKLAAVSSKDSDSGEDIHHFQNPYFNRNRPELLGHVRRASNRRRGGSENAENSYFTTAPPCHFGPFGGSPDVCPRTFFHHQGATYAPVKLSHHYAEPLHDINNRFNPYCRPTAAGFGQGQHRYGRAWGGAGSGGGGLQGLALIANTTSGSLTATCPSESRPVDYPALYNQQGQLRKFVVIQEDVGQSLQGSCGSLHVSLSREDDQLLSNSCDPMMCATPHPSTPHQAPPQMFFLSPPSAPQGKRVNYYPTTETSVGLPQRIPTPPPAGMRLTGRSSPVVLTQLSPVTSARIKTQQYTQVASQNSTMVTSLPAAVTVSCGNIGAISSVISNRAPSPSSALQGQGST